MHNVLVYWSLSDTERKYAHSMPILVIEIKQKDEAVNAPGADAEWWSSMFVVQEVKNLDNFDDKTSIERERV